jgi:hypothetical protein
MHARTHGEVTIPRPLLIGAGLLIAFTIALTALARKDFADRAANPVAEQSRDIRFEDGADGSVLVFEAQGNQRIATLPPGTHGFVRGTMRGLARATVTSPWMTWPPGDA